MALLFLTLISLCWTKVKISEVVPHSDVEDGYYDYVELYNTDDKEAEDISGWYLSDKGSERLRCRIQPGTVLGPKQSRSFSFQGVNEGAPPMTGYCPFRLSKINDHIYLGRVVNGKYEEMDDVNIGATMNRVSNSRWKTSDDKDHYMMAFPTENFDNRYPVVGPFVISEIVWAPPAGRQQYVKITCIFGKTSWAGTASLTTHWGQRFQIRFEQHKDLYNNDVLTPAAIDLPTSMVLSKDESFYVVSGNPSTFAAQEGVPASRVVGPWKGNLYNATSGEVWVGFFGQEHSGMMPLEKVKWLPKEKNGWRPMKNGGIRKVSLYSFANEPKNWIGIGNSIPCNLTAAYPASDCPHMDDCTANVCVNQGGKGVCVYDALVCNHKNWDKCYPDYICKLPAPSRYNAGCKLASGVFGHTTSDTEAWGFYVNTPLGGTVGNEVLWYDIGCTKRALDCDAGDWDKWSKCRDCHDNQNRTRKIQQAPTDAPFAGKACPETFQKRFCNYDGKCKPCDYLKCTAPYVCWPNLTNFTATCEIPVPCVLSDWQQGPCNVTCGGGIGSRFRTIVKEAKFGGACDPFRTIPEPCNEFPCPVDCKWTDWSSYSSCSATCGGGLQTRTRSIKTQAAHGGVQCTGEASQTVECNLSPCPVHCFGAWEEWTGCNCLTQTQTRTFQIYEQASNGGKACSSSHGETQSQGCTTDSCVPIDCSGTWSAWTNCSCLYHVQSATFKITTDAAFGGTPCPEPTKTQKCEPVGCSDSVQGATGLPGWAIAIIVIGVLVGAAVLVAVAIGCFTAVASGQEGAYTAM